MCAHVQARQDSLLGDSRSRVQAPQQAGESDQAEHSHSLVHFGGDPVLQASDASIVDDYEDDLQCRWPSAARVRSFREGWPGRDGALFAPIAGRDVKCCRALAAPSPTESCWC